MCAAEASHSTSSALDGGRRLIFPDWPQQIAMLFPVSWIVQLIWQVAVMGEALPSVALELGIAMVITVGLGVLAARLARRMQAQLAGA